MRNIQKKLEYDKKRKNTLKYKAWQKNYDLKKVHNITIVEYNILYNNQNGVCAICGKIETGKHQNGVVVKLSVDHDHKTGKIRGLLCRNCNHLLGKAMDDIHILEKSIEYLKK